MDDPNRLVRIEDKLDQVSDKLHAVDITLAAQHVSLEDHIRRTELLEEEVRPIKRHVDRVNGALKLLGVLLLVFELYKAIK